MAALSQILILEGVDDPGVAAPAGLSAAMDQGGRLHLPTAGCRIIAGSGDLKLFRR